MDYAKILAELESASLFELYRLNAAIARQLEDPKRLEAIKRRLRPGQDITYFDSIENRLIEATIIDLKRTRLLVLNKHDRKRWNIPFYYINLDNVDTDIKDALSKQKIDRSRLKVGDKVGFLNKQGNELYGEVIKLNPKTAIVLVGGRVRWRVAYSLLFSVIDGARLEDGNLIEGQLVKSE